MPSPVILFLSVHAHFSLWSSIISGNSVCVRNFQYDASSWVLLLFACNFKVKLKRWEIVIRKLCKALTKSKKRNPLHTFCTRISCSLLSATLFDGFFFPLLFSMHTKREWPRFASWYIRSICGKRLLFFCCNHFYCAITPQQITEIHGTSFDLRSWIKGSMASKLQVNFFSNDRIFCVQTQIILKYAFAKLSDWIWWQMQVNYLNISYNSSSSGSIQRT